MNFEKSKFQSGYGYASSKTEIVNVKINKDWASHGHWPTSANGAHPAWNVAPCQSLRKCPWLEGSVRCKSVTVRSGEEGEIGGKQTESTESCEISKGRDGCVDFVVVSVLRSLYGFGYRFIQRK